MSKNELTKEQNKELQSLIDEITDEAKKLVDDYINNPSEMSGSITQIHEQSPYLATKEEWLKLVPGVNKIFGDEETDDDK